MDRLYAKIYGYAGDDPRAAGLVRALTPLLLVTFGFGWLVRAAFPLPRMNSAQTGAAFILLAAIGFILMRIVEQRVASFVKGARGEEDVARELGFLPADYIVIHGVSCTEGNCDHVVAGPNGVFAVETKNWQGRISCADGRILYDGQEPDRSPVRQVRNAANDLAARLTERLHREITVQPVICFTGSHPAGDFSNFENLVVCHRSGLNENLMSIRGTQLDGQSLKMIAGTLAPEPERLP